MISKALVGFSVPDYLPSMTVQYNTTLALVALTLALVALTLALGQVASLELWLDVLYSAMDAPQNVGDNAVMGRVTLGLQT